MGKRSWIPEQKDEYLGNMWGWKFSLIGLALIVLMLLLMTYRSCQIADEAQPAHIEQTKETER
jgi:predicted MFS family arabinose efflux permease